LTVGQIQRLIDQLQDAGARPNYVCHVQRVLCSALTAAERQGLVTRNVAKLVELPPKEREEVVPLTPEEAERLLQAVQDIRLGPLYTTMLTLGLRVGEATGLRWEDVDLEGREVHIRVQAQKEGAQWVLKGLKSRSGKRTIPLPARALDAIRGQRARI